jgi:glycosyltransferase involved in cell wall biosynthesis
MRRLRILLVSQYFWPEAFRINDLARSLFARGHDVRVLTGQPNYPSGRIFKGYGAIRKWSDSYQEIPIDRVPIWARRTGGRIHLSLNYLSFVVSALVFGLTRLRGRFDCTFVFAVSPLTQCLPAIVYKWMTGTPVVVWVQDLWPESISAVGAIKNTKILKWVERLVRFIYAHCDLIMIQSEAFRANVACFVDDPTKIHYMPNWAEDLYVPVDKDAAAGAAGELPSGFKVIFAGNVGRAQAMPTLIEAAKRLRAYEDIHWVILGDGTERERSRQLVEELGLETTVHFLGRKPVESMPQYFSQADALVVTLKADPIFSHVIPSRIQSYFACARPVIAALDGEGQRVVRESGAGLVGAGEDAAQLAENVLNLYKMSPQDRAEMGRRGLEYYRRHFDRQTVITDLEERLNSLELRVSPV